MWVRGGEFPRHYRRIAGPETHKTLSKTSISATFPLFFPPILQGLFRSVPLALGGARFPCHQGKMQGTKFLGADLADLGFHNPSPHKGFHSGWIKIPAFPAGNFLVPCRERFRASRDQFRRRRAPSEQVGAPACSTCSFRFNRSGGTGDAASAFAHAFDYAHLFNGLISNRSTSPPLKHRQNNK